MRKAAVAFAAFCLMTASAAEMREWTSAAGSKVVAEFVELTGNLVTLRDGNGQSITIFKHLLSAEDQAYIDELLAAQSEPAPGAGPLGTAFSSASRPAPAAAAAAGTAGSLVEGRYLPREEVAKLASEVDDPRSGGKIVLSASLALDRNAAQNRNWREGRSLRVRLIIETHRIMTNRSGQTQRIRETAGRVNWYLLDERGEVVPGMSGTTSLGSLCPT